jgi:hypothetical protein
MTGGASGSSALFLVRTYRSGRVDDPVASYLVPPGIDSIRVVTVPRQTTFRGCFGYVLNPVKFGWCILCLLSGMFVSLKVTSSMVYRRLLYGLLLV